jgi:hypothetical protein
MARSRIWHLTAGETVDLAKDLSGDLDDDESLDGNPEVTVWEKSGSTYTDVTADFTVANEQVNTEALDIIGGGTIAIGDGVAFRLTASETPGTYEVRVECDGDDGSHPVSVVKLVVSGPGSPS